MAHGCGVVKGLERRNPFPTNIPQPFQISANLRALGLRRAARDSGTGLEIIA